MIGPAVRGRTPAKNRIRARPEKSHEKQMTATSKSFEQHQGDLPETKRILRKLPNEAEDVTKEKFGGGGRQSFVWDNPFKAISL